MPAVTAWQDGYAQMVPRSSVVAMLLVALPLAWYHLCAAGWICCVVNIRHKLKHISFTPRRHVCLHRPISYVFFSEGAERYTMRARVLDSNLSWIWHRKPVHVSIVGQIQDSSKMPISVHVAAVPGFLVAEDTKRRGASIVMLPMHAHVLLLVFIDEECRFTIVRLLVIRETSGWIARLSLQYLFCFGHVNGWSKISFAKTSPNVLTFHVCPFEWHSISGTVTTLRWWCWSVLN